MLKHMLVIILLLHLATALTLQSYNVTFWLQDSGDSKQVIDTTFTPDAPLPLMDLELAGSTRITTVMCEPHCTYAAEGKNVTITFDQEVPQGQPTRLHLEYFVPQAVIDEPPNKLFVHTFKPDSFISSFQLELILPLRAVLADTVDPIRKPTIFPNARVSSDGKSILLIWSIQNLVPNSEHIFLTRYTTASDYSLLIALGIVLFLGIGIVLFLYFRAPTKPIAPAKKEVPTPAMPATPAPVPAPQAEPEKIKAILSPDENRAFELIRSSPGIQQNKLVRILGFNKVKASRVISRLENAKLIRKERAGITNELYVN